MKYWLSHLPLEVWVDVYRYPWISRRKLARIVHKFRNRKYAEYLQFYLHDWGKQKLTNWLCFDKDGICKYVDYVRHCLHFPQTPMPGNIKSFERISIYHYDTQTMHFLHQIGPILTNVSFEFCYFSPNEMENLRVILTNIVPLLNGTHSLSFDICALPTVKQCFGEEFNKVKVLDIYGYGSEEIGEAAVQSMADTILKWLILSPGNGPKYCKAVLSNALFEKIFPAIRQEFFAAKISRTFALYLDLSNWALQQFAGFHLQNGIGEQLHGVKEYGFIQITRHPADCETELQEWVEANTWRNHGQIRIINPTIGLLNAIMDAPENLEEANQQKPSTSKAV